MKEQLRRFVVACASAALAGSAGLTMAAPLESVLGLDVHNPGAFLAALDKYYASSESQGRKVALWSVSFRGDSDVSHLAIANYDSYDDYENVTDSMSSSQAWGQFVGSLGGVLDVKSRLMAIERFRQGDGWRDHGAIAAFVMTITDPGAYATAFSEFVDATDNPGSVRLMELRFGGEGATHAVVISAENSAILNEYLDEIFSGAAYRTFIGKVGAIRTIHNIELLRRVASFGD